MPAGAGIRNLHNSALEEGPVLAASSNSPLTRYAEAATEAETIGYLTGWTSELRVPDPGTGKLQPSNWSFDIKLILDQVVSAALAGLAPPPGGAVYTRSCGELFANIAATSAARFPIPNRHQPLYKRVPHSSQSSVNENASSTNLDVAAVAGGLRRASEFNMTSGIDGFAAEAIANNLA